MRFWRYNTYLGRHCTTYTYRYSIYAEDHKVFGVYIYVCVCMHVRMYMHTIIECIILIRISNNNTELVLHVHMYYCIARTFVQVELCGKFNLISLRVGEWIDLVRTNKTCDTLIQFGIWQITDNSSNFPTKLSRYMIRTYKDMYLILQYVCMDIKYYYIICTCTHVLYFLLFAKFIA